jgi:hypothetical protein
MPKKEPLFSFRLTGLVLARLGLRAKEQGALLATAGLPESAATGACTVPLSRVRAFLDEASRIAGDPLLGLLVAETIPEGTYEAAELLVRTAPTVRAGLAALAEHASLVNPIGQFRYEETKRGAEIHYMVPGQKDALGPHMNELTVAYLHRGLRLQAARELPLVSVWFGHTRASERERAAIAAHFGCPVRFGAASSGFAIPMDAAQSALRSSDGVVFDYLSRQASKAKNAGAEMPFSQSVARAIDEEIGFAKADLANVAKHLAVTARTAQRRLREEGTQFRDVVEQARRRRSEALVQRGVSDDKIAAQLGFADVGTYRRAAKRWADGD